MSRCSTRTWRPIEYGYVTTTTSQNTRCHRRKPNVASYPMSQAFIAEEPASVPTSVPDWRKVVTESLTSLDNQALRPHIFEMLAKHSSGWDASLGEIKATEHRIELIPGTKPIRQVPYRVCHASRQVIQEQVDEMLQKRVIELARSEWASPVVLVPKADAGLRVCVDYWKLNEVKNEIHIHYLE